MREKIFILCLSLLLGSAMIDCQKILACYKALSNYSEQIQREADSDKISRILPVEIRYICLSGCEQTSEVSYFILETDIELFCLIFPKNIRVNGTRIKHNPT